jgi:hypothetical protein
MLDARPASWYEVRNVICPFLCNSLRNILTRKLNCKTIMHTYVISEFQVWGTLFLKVAMVATYYLPKPVQLHDV